MAKGDLKAVGGMVLGIFIGAVVYKTGKYLVTGELHFGASDIESYVPVFIGLLVSYIIVEKTHSR